MYEQVPMANITKVEPQSMTSRTDQSPQELKAPRPGITEPIDVAELVSMARSRDASSDSTSAWEVE